MPRPALPWLVARVEAQALGQLELGLDNRIIIILIYTQSHNQIFRVQKRRLINVKVIPQLIAASPTT